MRWFSLGIPALAHPPAAGLCVNGWRGEEDIEGLDELAEIYIAGLIDLSVVVTYTSVHFHQVMMAVAVARLDVFGLRQWREISSIDKVLSWEHTWHLRNKSKDLCYLISSHLVWNKTHLPSTFIAALSGR